ncbi:HNH endonuclease [Leclercia tamurae]|uniref:HNH endonuclease n=1 Tax=Leclercia tamurae TaxID=2926467 RepID=UPI0036F480C5
MRKSCEYLRQPAPMPTIGTTVERVPDVIVTPQPAREPQPVELHDGHVAARRKWRKALADMLREERASREGQSAFRAAVLANYGGRCAITGTAADVEAAHIEPWRENGNQEPDNGIPMAWALHKCYDRFPAMFAIHPDTLRIHVRPDAVGLEGYDGRQIADGQHTPLNRDALRARWAAFVATAS